MQCVIGPVSRAARLYVLWVCGTPVPPSRPKPPPPVTRPAPLVEVRPQKGHERHCGTGFELVLDVTVPQLGRELVEVLNVVSQVIQQNVDIPVHGGR